MKKILRHKHLKIEISKKFQVMNCWKGKNVRIKMPLTDTKSCNLLPQVGEIRNV